MSRDTLDPTSYPEVSVIIPTAASAARADHLRRCVESIRKSSEKPVRIIAVGNGDQMDAGVLLWLGSQADVTVLIDKMPSAPNAQRRGREVVDTHFFSFVDDDDEYLPGSTDLKLAALLDAPEADFLVANGYRNSGHGDEPLHVDLPRLTKNPLHGMLEQVWLTNCNALFRTASVGEEFFADFHPYVEWTWLAYRLSVAGKTLLTLDRPCCRYNETQNSLSRSSKYQDAHLSLFARMLELAPDAATRRLIRKKIADALHEESNRALANGQYGRATRAHLKSLLLPGGRRYLTYTRRLLPWWPNADLPG